LAAPVFCTKIASRLTRTYADRHGLKDICRELLGVDLSKQQQSPDRAAETAQRRAISPTPRRMRCTCIELHAKLDALLVRDGRKPIAEACFGFLPAPGAA